MTHAEAMKAKPGDHIVFQTGLWKGCTAIITTVEPANKEGDIRFTYNMHGRMGSTVHRRLILLQS